MPYVTLMIPQHEVTVSRPVATEILEDFVTVFGLPEGTEVIVKNKLEGRPLPGATADDKVKDIEQFAKLLPNTIMATVKETYLEEGLLNSTVYRSNHRPIFYDASLGLWIKPTYGTTRLEFDVRINFRNRSDLMGLRRRLRIAGGLHMAHVKHAVRYNYGLPNTIALFLYDVHQLRESVAGYGEDLQTYLNAHFTAGRVNRSNATGETSRVAIDEIQSGIFGRYGDEVFYNEVESEDGVFSLEYQYTLEYEQVLGMVMRYPNVIHNQDIPSKYNEWWQPPVYVSNEPILQHGRSRGPDRPLIQGQYPTGGGYRVDPTDEWLPSAVAHNTKSVLLSPLFTDDNDPNALFHIDDFTDVELPPIVKDYIKTFPMDIIEQNRVPYLVQAFRVSNVEEEITLVCDIDGYVRSVVPMDPRRRNYLRISMMVDLGYLNRNQVTYLINNPYACEGVFNLINPDVFLNTDGWLETTPDGMAITAHSFRESVKRMPTTGAAYRETAIYKPASVMTTTIILKDKIT